ncbi:MAG: MBL fold metallo-hydrolase [Oscillospiraceae bacterium]|nr:MBL fold metallo-hydrolase [Oscillospiraceae bacterium]
MVTKVWDCPTVYQIPVDLPQNPLRMLNVYVICTPERNLVLDTGFNRPECREDLWSGLEELDLDLSKTAVFLTHLHSDHTGLVGTFVERDIPVYMGAVEHAYFNTLHGSGSLTVQEARFRQEGFPEEVLARQGTENQGRRYAPKPGFPVLPVEDGAQLPGFPVKITALHTPGHTPGHMVLYLPEEQVLFSGDHILFDITPNISVWHQISHPLADYLRSLEKIRTLPIRAAFPAHRAGSEDVYGRIDQLAAHHAARLEEILRAVEDNPGCSAYDVAGQISWSTRGVGWKDFPPHQRWFAMGETLAHLDYLREENRVSRTETEAGFRYRAGSVPMG